MPSTASSVLCEEFPFLNYASVKNLQANQQKETKVTKFISNVSVMASSVLVEQRF